jgi:protein-L-isoaspartate(D-aspartate) O-methyltransferase
VHKKDTLSPLATILCEQGIQDKRILSAISHLNRAEFVPHDLRHFSERNHPLPIGFEQTISQPYIVGLMTELAKLTGDEKVLEIGTGSGYQTAILSILAKQVYTIEIVPELASSAQMRLIQMGYDNISFREGDGIVGWPSEAPFDVIMITAAPHEIPVRLLSQLKIDGRLIGPVGRQQQELISVCYDGKVYTEARHLPVRFVPMTGEIDRLAE